MNVAKAIAEFEPVTICASPEVYKECTSKCPANISVVQMEMNDAWFRDIGPTFVQSKSGDVRGVNWKFNAWGGLNGGCYSDWSKDETVAPHICDIVGYKRYDAPFILEGGSIHVDGEGTLITTSECLLNPNRNPDLNKQQIEQYLKEYTGATKVIWLPHGLYGDVDTNGHVDNLCCFVRPGEVALAWTNNPSDPQFGICREAEAVLTMTPDARGRTVKIHKIPIPDPTLTRTDKEANGVIHEDGTISREYGRLPGSYINFYMANEGIVLPAFDVPTDEVVRKQFQEIFPDRKIVSVKSREILLGGGNIHCITQQMPSKY